MEASTLTVEKGAWLGIVPAAGALALSSARGGLQAASFRSLLEVLEDARGSLALSKGARLGGDQAARGSLATLSARGALQTASLRSRAVVEDRRASLGISTATDLAALPPRAWTDEGLVFSTVRVASGPNSSIVATPLASIGANAHLRATTAAFEYRVLPRYIPGPLRPSTRNGAACAVDVLRVSDSSGAFTDWEMVVLAQVFVRPIVVFTAPIGSTYGDPNEAWGSVELGYQVQCAATGGTGPYTYALTRNATGGTVDPVTGLYTAGPVVEEDIVTVTDAVGGTAPITINVRASELWLDVNRAASGLTADFTFLTMSGAMDYPIRAVQGTGWGYQVEMLSSESGATFVPGNPDRIAVKLVDRAGAPATGLDRRTYKGTLRAVDWSVAVPDLPGVGEGDTLSISVPSLNVWSLALGDALVTLADGSPLTMDDGTPLTMDTGTLLAMDDGQPLTLDDGASLTMDDVPPELAAHLILLIATEPLTP